MRRRTKVPEVPAEVALQTGRWAVLSLPCPAWGGTDPCLPGAALSGKVRGMNFALAGAVSASVQRIPDGQGVDTVRVASALTEGSRPVTGHSALILSRAGGSARMRLSVAELMACSP